MENQNIDLKKFYKDFDYCNQMADERYKILTLQLYMEHFINELIKIKSGEFPAKTIRETLSIPVKSQILLDWKTITKEEKKIIDILAKTRNDLMHNLVIDMEKLKKRLKSTNFEFIKDKEGKKIKVFEYLRPYAQLISSSAVLISILYTKLEKLKGNEVKQMIRLEIRKVGEKYQHIIRFFEKRDSV